MMNTFVRESSLEVSQPFNFRQSIFLLRVLYTSRYKMSKTLERNVQWLQFIGIVTTIDFYGVPDNNPNKRELIAANFRIFRHALLAFVILVPQVFIMNIFSEFDIIIS